MWRLKSTHRAKKNFATLMSTKPSMAKAKAMANASLFLVTLTSSSPKHLNAPPTPMPKTSLHRPNGKQRSGIGSRACNWLGTTKDSVVSFWLNLVRFPRHRRKHSQQFRLTIPTWNRPNPNPRSPTTRVRVRVVDEDVGGKPVTERNLMH